MQVTQQKYYFMNYYQHINEIYEKHKFFNQEIFSVQRILNYKTTKNNLMERVY